MVEKPARREPTLPGSPSTSGHSQPTDVGRTQGGGQLGHGHEPTTAEERHIRNQRPTDRDQNLRDREPPDPLPELEP